uniref:Transcriptional regulator, GntR family/aminotransferase class-I n=1 Tax=mine drainage metagenome TaxID=410659 RepID=E6PPA6_9ZZZZ
MLVVSVTVCAGTAATLSAMMQAMNDSPPLYQVLADRLEGLARTGSLKIGTRLPSMRHHAQQQGVSISTVLQAYRTLEDRGVIEARPKSGFFVRPTRKAPQESKPPAKPAMVEVRAIVDTVLRAAGDPRYISFGAAQASSDLYPNQRLRRGIARSAQLHAETIGRYPQLAGMIELRQAISHHALSMGCDLDHREIVVTHGCREAIGLCLRAVTAPGDIVAIESPAYFGFLQNLQSTSLRAVEIPTHPRTGMSLDALEFALDTQPVRAIVVVPTVSNPIGSTMPVTAKRRLAALAAQRNIPVIEDVICNDLASSQEGRRAAKSFDRTGHVMICGSFSKTLAPGLAVGWVEAGRWSRQVAELKRACSAGSVGFVELALAEMLDRGSYEQSLRRLRGIFAAQVATGRQIIGDAFPKGTRMTDPSGGFFLRVELPSGIDSIELYKRCLAMQLVIVPGALFTTSKRYQNCIRLNVGERWSAARIEGLKTIGRVACEIMEEASRGET